MVQDGSYAPIASFDVFDTVLTRRVGDPRAAFLLLARRLAGKGLIECSPHAFAAARKNAEIRTFANHGGLDSHTSLANIYSELATAISVSPPQIDKLVSEELQLERELLVPVADGVKRVDQARRRGEAIIYVSDMYVDHDFLRDELERHGLFHPGDRLFVSCEFAKSKATGKLWDVVLRELDVAPSAIHHTGNDRRSDHRSARRAGLGSTHVARNNLNRFERALEDHAMATDGVSSALAGASRLARLTDGELSTTETALRDVAAGVVAPFLIGKVLWILEQAAAEGLEALYFVSRDGKLLRDVALELAPKVGYRGELRFLHGSRQAWALPSITSANSPIINTLCPDDGDIDATLRTVLHRLSVEPESVADLLDLAGFRPGSFDQAIDSAARQRLRDFLNTPAIESRLAERATRARDTMLTYLRQEGMLDDRPVGLVDLGTGATLFNSLSSVLRSVEIGPPVGFYFGLRADVADSGFGFPRAYVRNEAARLGHLKTPGLLTLFEMVCTTEEATVTGYEMSDGRARAVFGDHDNRAVVEWGLEVVQETVVCVAERLLLDPDLVSYRQVDLRPAILDVFKQFWNSPTRGEAEAWGAYPFEDGWGNDSIQFPIAERLTPTAALRQWPHRHWWDAGARRLSDPLTRSLLRGRSETLRAVERLQRASSSRQARQR